MKVYITRSTVSSKPELLQQFVHVASSHMDFLRESYPNFDKWMFEKVVPGIYAGERTVILKQRGLDVAGLLIIKHTPNEKKLCTLRVHPDFESLGLGVRLFETAFDLLGTDHPLLSVSEPSLPKFARLFKYFGFSKEAVYGGRYLSSVNEISYNGHLEPTGISSSDSPTFFNHMNGPIVRQPSSAKQPRRFLPA